MTETDIVRPGDVIAVDTGNKIFARLIRVGEAIAGLPPLDNHVIIVHHQSRAGGWVGIDATPHGVAWADATPYLGLKRTRCNDLQPRTDEQNRAIVTACTSMMRIAYDWGAIVVDALRDLGVPTGWAAEWRGRPASVVCSSLAAWAYMKVGVPHPCPGRERYCQPSDWTTWVDDQGWLM